MWHGTGTVHDLLKYIVQSLGTGICSRQTMTELAGVGFEPTATGFLVHYSAS